MNLRPMHHKSAQSQAELSAGQVNQLISIAGDHSASEEQWLQACSLLEGFEPKSSEIRRTRNRMPALALALVAVATISVAGLGFGLSWHGQMAKSSAPSAVPVTSETSAPVSPPVAVHSTGSAAMDYGPYIASLQRRIKRSWFPLKSDQSRHVEVLFKIDREGHMSGLRVVRSSGVESADQAALKAVENAAPFRRLPVGSAEHVDVEFSFDYNVFKRS